jgi:hypothetical protein
MVMNTVDSNPQTNETIELTPSYNIPLILILVSLPLALIQLWPAVAIALLGLFLMLQAVMIKLQFTPTALDIYRGNKLIRSFPYEEWENWRIFWQPVPILLYFKEVKSIHFLPIIFNAKMLSQCLDKYCPQKQ